MERLRVAIEQARKARAATVPGAAETPAEAGGKPDRTARPMRISGDVPIANGLAEDAEAALNGHSGQGNGLARASEPDKDVVRARWDALTKITLKSGRLRRSRLVADSGGNDRAAFDMLRTRLLNLMQKEGWRRVAITSPGPACGKSTTSLNLALALGRQSDVRSLVFEADMRRPSIAGMLGHKGKHSFFDVLRGKVDFADQAVRIADNVAVSMNHGTGDNSAELLHRQHTSAVLDMIDEAYRPDITIFDMPPMMNNDDTLAFIKNVDCAVLVALAEKTTLNEVDFCERELAAHTNVAGVVLNRCRFVGTQYGYADY